jgi:hypothetical protein
MTIDDVRAALGRRPFVPFVLHLSGDAGVRVPHPEFVHTLYNNRTVIVEGAEGAGYSVIDVDLVTRIAVGESTHTVGEPGET